jgi:hypothetical protein
MRGMITPTRLLLVVLVLVIVPHSIPRGGLLILSHPTAAADPFSRHDAICPPASVVSRLGCGPAFAVVVSPGVPAPQPVGFSGPPRSCPAGACARARDFVLAVVRPGISPGYPSGDEAIERTSRFCSHSARHVRRSAQMLLRYPIPARPGPPYAGPAHLPPLKKSPSWKAAETRAQPMESNSISNTRVESGGIAPG